MAQTPQDIHTTLSATFPEHELRFEESVPCIVVPASAVRDICLQLRDDPACGFDTLMLLSGVDNADGTFGIVYHLFSMRLRHKLTLKVRVPADDARVASVERVWRAADWHEREAYDMFGIVFEGHRDLRRILLPDDWEGYPLRKDYQTPEFYNGMKVPY